MESHDDSSASEELIATRFDRPFTDQEQVELARRLQTKWLLRIEDLLDTGRINATEMATLARVLQANGWVLDPSKLPHDIRDKITSDVDPEQLDNEDVILFKKRA